MMIRDITEPTQRYVAAFLDHVLQGESVTCAARKSVALPSIGNMTAPPFERFRNRLKIMAGLDPVLYKEPRTGNVEVVFERQSGSACTDARYSIELRFIDVGDDPVVELNARLIATEVFDPDTRL
jgi:hypothetical protein